MSVELEVVVRAAAAEDAPALAELVTQLGYPSDGPAVGRRLAELSGRADQLVAVAEVEGHVAGLLHARLRPTLLADGVAEIASLVVEDGWRSKGIGRRLLGRVEEWAAERGYGRLMVSSNAVRVRAHAFYQGNGFHKVKDSVYLEKEVGLGKPGASE